MKLVIKYKKNGLNKPFLSHLGGDEGGRTPVHDFSCDTFYMFSQSVEFIEPS